jgi:UPF0042 nucleotide-binding protein
MAAPLAFGVDTRTYGFSARTWCADCSSCAAPDLAPPALSSIATARPCSAATPNRAGPIRWRPTGRSVDGIVDERSRSAGMRDSADVVIDTSALSPHQFKQILAGHFALGQPPARASP